MKSIKLMVPVMLLFLAGLLQAQVSVSVNIGTPPLWGPVGYTEVNYYYLPDVEAYYDVQTSMFIYYSGGEWIHRTYLPDRYRNYDLYGGYKVVMNDYHGNTPYTHFKEYKKKYRRGYHGEAQRTIGERPERGNSGARISHEENNRNKESGRNAGKNVGHDNYKKVKKDQGHDNRKGKRK
jgi:hypothetical protein